jgi:hypothetical protein
MTEAQRRLLGHLIRIMREDTPEREKRWGINSDLVASYAANDRLLIARDWTADYVLEAVGVVSVVDTDDGNPDVLATGRETRRALFRSIHVYPELLSFLPPRPSEAVDCPNCEGTGVLEMSLENRTLRNVECYCSGAGWLLAGESPGV